MIDDPPSALHILNAVNMEILPFWDVFQANFNRNLEWVAQYESVNLNLPKKKNQPRMPIETGKFLMKKLTLSPQSYHGCMNVIDMYSQNGLYMLLQSLDRGLRDHLKDKVIANRNQIEIVLENIWKDSNRLKLETEGIRNGISVCIGALGEFATSTVGGFGGLLAGLGFNSLDRALDMNDSSLSRRLAEMINKDYLVNIYDFRHKHTLPS